MRQRAAIQQAVQAETAKFVRPQAPHPRLKRSQKAARVIKWFLGFWIPTVLAYLGIVAYMPQLKMTVLPPLNATNALTAPFEISNNGFFPVRNLQFSWNPRAMTFWDGTSGLYGYGEFMHVNRQLIRSLKPRETAPVRSMILEFSKDSPLSKAHLYITVSYQAYFLPFTFRERFRFGTATASNGEVRWYQRAVEE